MLHVRVPLSDDAVRFIPCPGDSPCCSFTATDGHVLFGHRNGAITLCSFDPYSSHFLDVVTIFPRLFNVSERRAKDENTVTSTIAPSMIDCLCACPFSATGDETTVSILHHNDRITFATLCSADGVTLKLGRSVSIATASSSSDSLQYTNRATAHCWLDDDTFLIGCLDGTVLAVSAMVSASPPRVLLRESSPIVQLHWDTRVNMLTVSSVQRSVLALFVDGSLEVRPLGTKPREEGVFGACSWPLNRAVYVARHNARVFEADGTTGAVTRTYRTPPDAELGTLRPLPLHVVAHAARTMPTQATVWEEENKTINEKKSEEEGNDDDDDDDGELTAPVILWSEGLRFITLLLLSPTDTQYVTRRFDDVALVCSILLSHVALVLCSDNRLMCVPFTSASTPMPDNDKRGTSIIDALSSPNPTGQRKNNGGAASPEALLMLKVTESTIESSSASDLVDDKGKHPHKLRRTKVVKRKVVRVIRRPKSARESATMTTEEFELPNMLEFGVSAAESEEHPIATEETGVISLEIAPAVEITTVKSSAHPSSSSSDTSGPAPCFLWHKERTINNDKKPSLPEITSTLSTPRTSSLHAEDHIPIQKTCNDKVNALDPLSSYLSASSNLPMMSEVDRTICNTKEALARAEMESTDEIMTRNNYRRFRVELDCLIRLFDVHALHTGEHSHLYTAVQEFLPLLEEQLLAAGLLLWPSEEALQCATLSSSSVKQKNPYGQLGQHTQVQMENEQNQNTKLEQQQQKQKHQAREPRLHRKAGRFFHEEEMTVMALRNVLQSALSWSLRHDDHTNVSHFTQSSIDNTKSGLDEERWMPVALLMQLLLALPLTGRDGSVNGNAEYRTISKKENGCNHSDNSLYGYDDEEERWQEEARVMERTVSRCGADSAYLPFVLALSGCVTSALPMRRLPVLLNGHERCAVSIAHLQAARRGPAASYTRRSNAAEQRLERCILEQSPNIIDAFEETPFPCCAFFAYFPYVYATFPSKATVLALQHYPGTSLAYFEWALSSSVQGLAHQTLREASKAYGTPSLIRLSFEDLADGLADLVLALCASSGSDMEAADTFSCLRLLLQRRFALLRWAMEAQRVRLLSLSAGANEVNYEVVVPMAQRKLRRLEEGALSLLQTMDLGRSEQKRHAVLELLDEWEFPEGVSMLGLLHDFIAYCVTRGRTERLLPLFQLPHCITKEDWTFLFSSAHAAGSLEVAMLFCLTVERQPTRVRHLLGKAFPSLSAMDDSAQADEQLQRVAKKLSMLS